MAHELREGRYEFGPYRAFLVKEPKTRLIESAWFRDRIVHHVIHETLEPIFDGVFLAQSFACRSGRGHHAAVLKLHQWIQGNPHRFILKCDVRKFFPSIDRDFLLAIIARTIKDEAFIACLEKLIRTAPGTKGIPIGNLTSQLFANIYLNELDQFIKRKLRIRHYMRYMDDFICLVNSASEAHEVRKSIKDFLDQSLKLELSPQKVIINPCTVGVSFLGYYLTPKQIRLRGSLLRRMRRKMGASKQCSEKLKATIFSYLGHIKYCTSDRLMSEFMLEKIAAIQQGQPGESGI